MGSAMGVGVEWYGSGSRRCDPLELEHFQSSVSSLKKNVPFGVILANTEGSLCFICVIPALKALSTLAEQTLDSFLV